MKTDEQTMEQVLLSSTSNGVITWKNRDTSGHHHPFSSTHFKKFLLNLRLARQKDYKICQTAVVHGSCWDRLHLRELGGHCDEGQILRINALLKV